MHWNISDSSRENPWSGFAATSGLAQKRLINHIGIGVHSDPPSNRRLIECDIWLAECIAVCRHLGSHSDFRSLRVRVLHGICASLDFYIFWFSSCHCVIEDRGSDKSESR